MSSASIATSTRDVAVGSLRMPASAAISEIVLANETSESVSAFAACVTSATLTRSGYRRSTSGWWSAASAAAAIRPTNSAPASNDPARKLASMRPSSTRQSGRSASASNSVAVTLFAMTRTLRADPRPGAPRPRVCVTDIGEDRRLR